MIAISNFGVDRSSILSECLLWVLSECWAVPRFDEVMLSVDNAKQDVTRAAGLPAQSSIARVEDSLAKVTAVAAEVQRIRLMAQRELELAKRLRTEAEQYWKATQAKAHSQAQMLILSARLSTKKEIEEIKRKSIAEVQNILDEMRMLRVTAVEELEAQRKFTDAARICALYLPFQEEVEKKEKSEEERVAV